MVMEAHRASIVNSHSKYIANTSVAACLDMSSTPEVFLLQRVQCFCKRVWDVVQLSPKKLAKRSRFRPDLTCTATLEVTHFVTIFDREHWDALPSAGLHSNNNANTTTMNASREDPGYLGQSCH